MAVFTSSIVEAMHMLFNSFRFKTHLLVGGSADIVDPGMESKARKLVYKNRAFIIGQ